MIKQIISFSRRLQNKGLTEESDSVLANTARSQTPRWLTQRGVRLRAVKQSKGIFILLSLFQPAASVVNVLYCSGGGPCGVCNWDVDCVLAGYEDPPEFQIFPYFFRGVFQISLRILLVMSGKFVVASETFWPRGPLNTQM